MTPRKFSHEENPKSPAFEVAMRFWGPRGGQGLFCFEEHRLEICTDHRRHRSGEVVNGTDSPPKNNAPGNADVPVGTNNHDGGTKDADEAVGAPRDDLRAATPGACMPFSGRHDETHEHHNKTPTILQRTQPLAQTGFSARVTPESLLALLRNRWPTWAGICINPVIPSEKSRQDNRIHRIEIRILSIL